MLRWRLLNALVKKFGMNYSRKEKNMKIAIDFDGTIAEHEFPSIGEKVPGAFHYMKEFQKQGFKLILFTMRSDDTLQEAVDFCRKNGVEFYGVNTDPDQKSWTSSPKAYSNIYVDDAAYGCPLIVGKSVRPYVNWQVVGSDILAKHARFGYELYEA